MKSKFHIFFFIAFVTSIQIADAQFFKRLKNRVNQKAKSIENKVINKLDKKIDTKIDKTIDQTVETKENKKRKTAPKEEATSLKEKDFGDVTINHSKTYGNITLTEVRQIKVDKTNTGYNIYGNWWSHKADVYDGFFLTLVTNKDLKNNVKTKATFKIPEEASLKVGYDPTLPYNKESEDGFSRAITENYQKYNITKGEVHIDEISDNNIKISFSGRTSLTKLNKNSTNEIYNKIPYDATVSGNIDGKTPLFQNQETIVKNNTKNDKPSSRELDNLDTNNTHTTTPGIYQFSHETITKITVPKEDKNYEISYLLNPNAKYIAIRADLGAYSSGGMEGESIIVMDNENVQIFVESNGMKMRLSNGMMGQEKMSDLTNQMNKYNYKKLKKTGNSKTILGTICYEYAMADSTTKINFWAAPSIKLPNWFVQEKGVIDGYIMEYTIQSKEGNMTSTTVAIKDHINKVIDSKEYKKMF
ncbi:hypothetical protein BTO06_10250 [Tenacibaculum sp. SZ-18]|uniref:hypothetical protein n=1 Tax=Tenacibaculum sp. SZ-18 TaxID=754423 RepID=UPI000C2D4614|nr:hypothetical protein [Tenacibaculum sp. SZ-18]AUC15497.1 hypothetical protein BTO06_10250 [Tenacibaculum sp. SZ-18]